MTSMGPRVGPAGGGVCPVTFTWDASRADGGSPESVHLIVNGVTRRRDLQSGLMESLGGDQWELTIDIPPAWRGSYGFIPSRGEWPAAPDDLAWWRNFYAGVRPDPANPGPSHTTMLGGRYSELSLPDAPNPRWTGPEQRAADRVSGMVTSTINLAGIERRLWTYEVGAATGPRDLVVCFDGHYWATEMPVFGGFDRMQSGLGLNPLLLVLVDPVDLTTRGRDLTCSPEFRQSIIDDLIPALTADHEITDDPLRRVVAGQSLGGLAALDLVLSHPDVFGSALCQSGSFWWPTHQATWTWVERLEEARHRNVRLWLQAGSLEGNMAAVSARLAEEARRAGVSVHHEEYCGGHEVVQWAEGLINGVADLLGNGVSSKAKEVG